MPTSSVAGRWLTRLGLVALTGCLFAILAALVVLPRATHARVLSVLTASMQPALPAGSAVIERSVDPMALRVGDIVTYQQTPGQAVYITHRIVAIDATSNPLTFTFKGDANRIADVISVPASAIRGKVWYDVPYVGRLRNGLGAAAVVVCVLGLGAFALCQAVAAARARQRRAASHDAAVHTEATVGAP